MFLYRIQKHIINFSQLKRSKLKKSVRFYKNVKLKNLIISETNKKSKA